MLHKIIKNFLLFFFKSIEKKKKKPLRPKKMEETTSPKCDICKSGSSTPHSVPEQGISCVRCGIAMCDICYHLSIKLYGFVGDKNLVLPIPKEASKTCLEWPFNEYVPENYGSFKLSRGCIQCMTESMPKRDKFGHFIKGDAYPQGESWLTRIIAERNSQNIGTHAIHLLDAL